LIPRRASEKKDPSVVPVGPVGSPVEILLGQAHGTVSVGAGELELKNPVHREQ